MNKMRQLIIERIKHKGWYDISFSGKARFSDPENDDTQKYVEYLNSLTDEKLLDTYGRVFPASRTC